MQRKFREGASPTLFWPEMLYYGLSYHVRPTIKKLGNICRLSTGGTMLTEIDSKQDVALACKNNVESS